MELLKNLEGLSADEQMSAVVELQKAAMKHLEEQKQASIGKSAELVIQGLKKIKSDFEAKFDSLNYDIQTKVASLKDGEQGIQGPKGDQGDRGLDGANGRDGRDGKDGRDGLDGQDGVGVRDAKIDFDGSLVITLTDGREINVGEVVSVDVAKQIQKVTHNIQTGAGGDSQTVLDAIAALQATIATYGTMATQNANNVAITGGTINNTTIGATTPNTGVFTTLTANSTATFGGDATNPSLVASAVSAPTRWLQVAGSAAGNVTLSVQGTGTPNLVIQNRSTGSINFATNNSASNVQAVVSHTASAVNYVQVTGAATGTGVVVSAQGSDSNVEMQLRPKGSGNMTLQDGNATAGLQVITRATGGDSFLTVQRDTSRVNLGIGGGATNASMVFLSKGTGAIDLAAGSSGVNISNGGTVTAITRTASGSAYTSVPSVAITAPTTAGGVQATASITMGLVAVASIGSGGTGYTVNDVLTASGGTFTTAAQVTVSAVSGGVITAVTALTAGSYTVLPSNPCSFTGGTGSGATINISWGVNSTFTITNAGSGYVEQPTVSFSGGGGSGAAAYATVGSQTTLKSLATSWLFDTAAGTQFQITSTSGANSYPFATGGSNGAGMGVTSSATNASFTFTSKGTSAIDFYTNGYGSLGLRVSHTASAVNYVQVTGAATSGLPQISAQGSDATIGISYATKGSSSHRFVVNGGDVARIETLGSTAPVNRFTLFGNTTGTGPMLVSTGTDTNVGMDLSTRGTGVYRFYTNAANNGTGVIQFRIAHVDSAVNQLQVIGAVAGAAPILSAQGTDTNIDLALTPKGTGVVQFGTYTATVTAVAGYILIKDSGGTTRKLAVLT